MSLCPRQSGRNDGRGGSCVMPLCPLRIPQPGSGRCRSSGSEVSGTQVGQGQSLKYKAQSNWSPPLRHVDADGDISPHSAERPLHYGRGDKHSAAMQRDCGRTGQPWWSASARVSLFRHCARSASWQVPSDGSCTAVGGNLSQTLAKTLLREISPLPSVGRNDRGWRSVEMTGEVLSRNDRERTVFCHVALSGGQVQVLRLRSLRHASRTRTKSQVQSTKQLVASSPSCRRRWRHLSALG
jgi:hypothetical protein